ncbi:hypothetical protein BJF90_40125 [Pseudonocardia sp. CNS-004]|nr:hypothetical protein BJF90_40125 [Pseudonocardia sp. CNS-004]
MASTTDVLAGPDDGADVVGVAAGHAAVPVECADGAWLRVGAGQYVEESAVAAPPRVGACLG